MFFSIEKIHIKIKKICKKIYFSEFVLLQAIFSRCLTTTKMSGFTEGTRIDNG